MRFQVDSDREVVLCGCKHTAAAPYCDGTHNNLSETYEGASDAEIRAAAAIPVTPRDQGKYGRSVLDGGCFVLTVSPESMVTRGCLRFASVIDRQAGAKFLSQYVAEVIEGATDVLRFPARDTVLFVAAGRGRVTVSGRPFEVGPETGVHVRPGEAFSIASTGTEPLRLLLTVCPQAAGPEWLDAMPEDFDAAHPERSAGVDESKRRSMADRFYQVLVGEETGSAEVTEFIGEIPQSRAAAHHHLYEEAIMILSGQGYLWTEHARAAVNPGDIIFLPRKQLHSLECTSTDGMRLMGVFYPAGSPAVNY